MKVRAAAGVKQAVRAAEKSHNQSIDSRLGVKVCQHLLLVLSQRQQGKQLPGESSEGRD